MVTCLEQGADLRMAQLMPLPLTVSCFSKIQIGFTFLVLAVPGSPGKKAVKWMCVLKAAVSVLVGPCCPALVNSIDVDLHCILLYYWANKMMMMMKSYVD